MMDASDPSSSSSSSSSSFYSFALILSQARQLSESHRLDPDLGTANAFSQLCQERSQLALDLATSQSIAQNLQTTFQDSEDDSLSWKTEGDTWRLIALLTSERAQRTRQEQQEASTSTSQIQNLNQSTSLDPYQTPVSKAQEILEKNESLSELFTLRRWLSSILPPTSNLEIRKGYKTFTKAKVRADKRTGGNGGTTASTSRNAPRKSTLGGGGGIGSRGNVKNLDPDAESRKEGNWEVEDKTYEKALIRTLFEYTRSGQLDLALDLVRQVDQPWRAASLMGGIMYYQPGLSHKPKNIGEDEEFGQEDVEEEVGSQPFGNRNRILWKGVCKKLAGNHGLDPNERALYGALCGDVNSVLEVSNSWIACLWAYVNHSLESSIDLQLEENDNWWSQNAYEGFNGNSVLNEFGSIKVLDLGTPVFNSGLIVKGNGNGKGKSQNGMEENGFQVMREIFSKVRDSSNEVIRIQGEDPLHVVEQRMIMDEIHSYVNSTVEPLRARAGEVIQGTEEYFQYVHAIRFLTHLILYLRLINYTSRSSSMVERPEMNETASVMWQQTCNDILVLYVDILKAEKQDDLVAMYASELEAQSATDQYAQYLIAMDPNSSQQTRREALLRAQEHNLNVSAVASRAVQFSFLQNFSSIPFPNSLPPPPSTISSKITYPEESLIRSIQWLTFNQETLNEALVQSNRLIRRFFSRGQVDCARILLNSLPEDLVSEIGEGIQVQKGQMKQLNGWKVYFNAIENHGGYKEIWSKRPAASSSRIDRFNWEKAISNLIENTKKIMLEILEMDWLKLESDDQDPEIADDYQIEELSLIRKIFIPEILLTLHFMLFESSEVIPNNLSEALKLANLVADEKYKLYLEFLSPEAKDNRLRNYLNQVRLVELRALELSDDPFKLA